MVRELLTVSQIADLLEEPPARISGYLLSLHRFAIGQGK